MKQQIWVATICCVLTLIITFSFNTIANHFPRDKGKVTVSDPVTISGSESMMVQIENWSSQPLNGLNLVFSNSISLTSITSSIPISIEDVQGYSGSQSLKQVRVSGIPAHQIVWIMIPIPTIKNRFNLFLPNVDQLNLNTQLNGYAADPATDAYLRTLGLGVLYSILIGIVTYFGQGWITRSDEKYKKERQEAMAKLEKMSADDAAEREKMKAVAVDLQNKLNRATAEAHATHIRLRLYLLARIRDYGHELDFWRNTIRKILLTGGLGKQPTEAVIKNITATLKTYGTQGAADDFDGILAAARLLSNAKDDKTFEQTSGCI
jgi:hypothetical protein